MNKKLVIGGVVIAVIFILILILAVPKTYVIANKQGLELDFGEYFVTGSELKVDGKLKVVINATGKFGFYVMDEENYLKFKNGDLADVLVYKPFSTDEPVKLWEIEGSISAGKYYFVVMNAELDTITVNIYIVFIA